MRTCFIHWAAVYPQVGEVLNRTDEWCEIIDVRSEREFAEDHIPGAINLPVLSDAQRHTIGCMYKESPLEGKKEGAAMVAENIAMHMRGHFKGKPGNYRPLVYCWRGVWVWWCEMGRHALEHTAPRA